jgi:aerobic carbon-monoxide dehydrogenase medium subunit
VLAGPSEERRVPAGEFFDGFYTTSAEPDEMVTELHFPRPARHAALTEFAQRQGDFAVVAAAVSVDLRESAPQTCRAVRIVLGGVGPLPFVVDTADLAGQPAAPATWRAAGELAAAQIDPPADGHGSAAYRKKLAATLVERALTDAGAAP